MNDENALPTDEFTPPRFKSDGFNCPHCGSFNHQEWFLSSIVFENRGSTGNQKTVSSFAYALCYRCQKFSVWLTNGERIIYPQESPAPKPQKDMPEEVLSDYLEARRIVSNSPRGAAALLRLATEKLAALLVKERIGESRVSDLNKNIGLLVRNGLPKTIQQALDSLRVIGNEAVHPGTLDLKDDQETALKLFRLVNVIVENQISQVKEIDEVYDKKLPTTKKDAIEKRDA